MAQQTAVEWLIENILCKNEEYINDDGDYIQIPKIVFYNAFKDYVDLSDYVNKAKQLEKEQIMKAYGQGYENATNYIEIGRQEYYNETYK